MMTKVSVAVMAHPSRARFVDELVPRLDADPQIVWDRCADRWDTGRRSLEAHDPSATHHLVVQDDAIVCRDLVAASTRAAASAGDRPVGLYTGRSRPYRVQVQQAYRAAEQAGATWLEMQGPWWGVALIIPTAHIPDLITWADRRREIPNYDKRISRWYGHQGIRCWYTMPSLVDHRLVAENPSLVPGRTGNRYAHQFIGADVSGLTVDWQPDAYRPGQTRQSHTAARRAALQDRRAALRQRRGLAPRRS